jgi:hypothetical protein
MHTANTIEQNNTENISIVKRNWWKFVSIFFILLFLLVLLGGLWRAYHFKPSFIPANASQIETVRSIALDDLQKRGENVSSYTVKVSKDLREIYPGSEQKKVLEVSVYNASERHLYIIDIQSEAVLLYSKTNFYDGLDHSTDKSIDMRPGGPRGSFNN